MIQFQVAPTEPEFGVIAFLIHSKKVTWKEAKTENKTT